MWQDAIIKGLKKPCVHAFEVFDIYKWEGKFRKQYSQDPLKDAMNLFCGKSTYHIVKRWVADCPICGKLWFSYSNKKDLKSALKQMNKKHKEISIQESIRYGNLRNNCED
jgi:hypothetical protein